MSAKAYWNPQRVVLLAEAMKQLAFQENGEWFFGQQGIHTRLATLLSSHPELSGADAGQGLNLLVFTGVLAPGKTGRKRTDYRRAFYPDKAAEVTPEDIKSFMIHRYSGRRA